MGDAMQYASKVAGHL